MPSYTSFCGGATLLALCAGMAGCASIFSTGNQQVAFTSTPVGAHVEVFDAKNNIKGSGKTPCTLTLARGAGFFQPARYTVRTSADGYPTRDVSIITNINGWYFGNIIIPIGSVFGMFLIDPMTGAMWQLSDTHIDLVPARPPAASNGPPSRSPAGFTTATAS